MNTEKLFEAYGWACIAVVAFINFFALWAVRQALTPLSLFWLAVIYLLPLVYVLTLAMGLVAREREKRLRREAFEQQAMNLPSDE